MFVSARNLCNSAKNLAWQRNICDVVWCACQTPSAGGLYWHNSLVGFPRIRRRVNRVHLSLRWVFGSLAGDVLTVSCHQWKCLTGV